MPTSALIPARSLAVTVLGTLLLAFASYSPAGDRPAGVPDEARWVKVDRITDGDTIVLMDRTRVRLHGIDAPERDQPYGPMATAALEYMVEKSVYVVEVDTDRYGRMVGQLYHSKEAMTSTPQWSAPALLGCTRDTRQTARCLRIARRKLRAHLKGFGKTRAPCPRGNGDEDREL